MRKKNFFFNNRTKNKKQRDCLLSLVKARETGNSQLVPLIIL